MSEKPGIDTSSVATAKQSEIGLDTELKIDQKALKAIAGALKRKEGDTVHDGADSSFEKFDWSNVPPDAIFIVVSKHLSQLKNLDNVRLVKLSDSYMAAVLEDPTKPGFLDDEISDHITDTFATVRESIIKPVIEYHNLRFDLPRQYHNQLSDVEKGHAVNASFYYHANEKWGIAETVYRKMSEEERQSWKANYGNFPPHNINYHETVRYNEIAARTPDEAYEIYVALKEVRKFDLDPTLRINKDESGGWVITARRVPRQDQEGIDFVEARGKTVDGVISEYKKLTVEE